MAVNPQSLNLYQSRWQRLLGKIGAYVALGLILGFTVFPIFWLFISSLKSDRELLAGNTILPNEWHFENYVELWQRIDFFAYFRNSILICGITALICTTLAVFASYALVRFRFPGSDFFNMAVLATQLIPGIMFLLPLYNMFLWINNTFGFKVLDTYHGIIFVYVAFFLPLSLFILRSFFATIPLELEEQAMVDGATRFGAFRRVILPLAGPGVVATAIYVFLSAWDELFFALRLTQSIGTETLPIGIRLFIGTQQASYALTLAAAVITTLPIMIAFFFLQKQMINGLTAGAVKS
jgi:multiple sugar transport system permease protein